MIEFDHYFDHTYAQIHVGSPKGENNIAMYGFGSGMALNGTGRAISLLLCLTGHWKQSSSLARHPLLAMELILSFWQSLVEGAATIESSLMSGWGLSLIFTQDGYKNTCMKLGVWKPERTATGVWYINGLRKINKVLIRDDNVMLRVYVGKEHLIW